MTISATNSGAVNANIDMDADGTVSIDGAEALISVQQPMLRWILTHLHYR